MKNNKKKFRRGRVLGSTLKGKSVRRERNVRSYWHMYGHTNTLTENQKKLIKSQNRQDLSLFLRIRSDEPSFPFPLRNIRQNRPLLLHHDLNMNKTI